MARRKNDHLLVLLSNAPWPVGMVLGLMVFFGIRDVLSPMLAQSQNIVLATVGKALADGAMGWIAWVLLALFWAAALVSYVRRRHRQHLLQARTGLDSLRAMRWQDFEKLVGEVFRQQGYDIEETGLGGADGGIDLVLRRQGERALVQCKQWRQRNVDVRVVREMFGLLAHHGAQQVMIVSLSDFTTDARRFARGKPIELIHGESLLALLRKAQGMSASTDTVVADALTEAALASDEAATVSAPPPSCPRCGRAMVQRSNRRNGDAFWGCTGFPACRGTRAIA